MDDILQEGGPIWTHFSIQATCKMCKDIVKIEWGVFSVLVTHMKQCHSQSIAFVPSDGDRNEDDIDDTKIKDEHEQQDSFMEEKPESIFIDKRNEDDMTMVDTKISGEQQEKQEYFMEEMPEPTSTGCPKKNYTLFWRAVAPLKFELSIKVGGVLEFSGSQL